jgi:hypothetical protein
MLDDYDPASAEYVSLYPLIIGINGRIISSNPSPFSNTFLDLMKVFPILYVEGSILLRNADVWES